jgi:MerR family transcriptional regulator, heat shock protein HspR
MMDFELSDDTPVYVISVAAQLSGLHPQTLRAYDRLGLVSPGRTVGRGRRYSLRDVLVLREVQRLSQVEGVNLSGIKRILELQHAEQRSRAKVAELLTEVAQLRAELESTRSVAARLAGLLHGRREGAALVPVRRSGGSARPAPERDAAPAQDAAPGQGTAPGKNTAQDKHAQQQRHAVPGQDTSAGQERGPAAVRRPIALPGAAEPRISTPQPGPGRQTDLRAAALPRANGLREIETDNGR